MKTLGIIGGIGPESTVEYYKMIIANYREKVNNGSYPAFLINNIDNTKMLGFVRSSKFSELVNYLADEIRKLASAGADFALLASNTPHIAFDELSRQSSIPLLSIVEAARDDVKKRAVSKVALLGTQFTMQGGFYQSIFEKVGIEVVAPNSEEQAIVHDKYMNELVNGIILDQTKEKLSRIIDRLNDDEKIEGIILGGTELPLLFTEDFYRDIPFFNTAKIHVLRAVEWMVS